MLGKNRMCYHLIFYRSLKSVGITLKEFHFLYMSVERFLITGQISLYPFPEHEQAQINIIEELINLQDEIFSGSGENSHFSNL